MARPKKDQAQNTRQQLADAATIAFGRHGFERASLSDIADSVGVSRTTLLHHFNNKESLYKEIVSDAFAQLSQELIASIAVTGGARKRLQYVARRFISFVEEHPPLAKLMVREMLDEDTPGASQIIERGIPVLEMVEDFIMGLGNFDPKQKPLLREVLLQVTTSVMLKSAIGANRSKIWGKKAQTKELALILLEGLIAE